MNRKSFNLGTLLDPERLVVTMVTWCHGYITPGELFLWGEDSCLMLMAGKRAGEGEAGWTGLGLH